MTIRDTMREYERMVETHPSLDHEFLRRFGEMEKDQFKQFMKEQYLLSVTLPQALGALYGIAEDAEYEETKIPRWKIAHPLIEFLDQENWGNEEQGSHSRYFLSVTNSLGIKLQELVDHEPFPETITFTETRTGIVRSGPFVKAAGALALGNEYANSFIFQKYLRGVERIKERTGTAIDTGYFEAHIRDEVPDYERFLSMVAPYLNKPDTRRIIEEGTKTLMEARARWYDGLVKRLF